MCLSRVIPLLVAACLLGGASSALALPADYTVPDEMPEAEVIIERMDDAIGGIELAPDGTLYFAVVEGPVYALDPGSSQPRVVFDPPVVRGPEWGIFDVILAPDHAQTGALIVSYSTAPEGTDATDSDVSGEVRVVRVVDGVESLIHSYPATRFHNSGRLLIHDGLLFLTRGEQNDRVQAKDPTNPAGNVLRMTLDGEPAPGNPYGDYTYAHGVRNPFGLGWDEKRDVLVLADVGQDKNEEVHHILPGKNYGWPACAGPCEWHEDPIVWYPQVVTPTGIAVIGDDYYHGSYNHGHVFRVYETDEGWKSEIVFTGSGNIVDLDRSHDGKWLYFGGFRGLYRIPTPEVSLATMDEPVVPDDAGNETVEDGTPAPGPGEDTQPDEGEDVVPGAGDPAPDTGGIDLNESNTPANVTPGPGLLAIVMVIGAAVAIARSRR